MVRRSIPPRTMRDVWAEQAAGAPGEAPPHRRKAPLKPAEKALREFRPSIGLGIGRPLVAKPLEKTYKPKVYRRPREWAYVTKPFFAKMKEPLVDIFKDAEEVQILIDLGGFSRDEVSFGLKGGKYVVYGRHGEQEFEEEIDLPEWVDLDNVVESFKNNILDLVLPRKTKPAVKKMPPRKKRAKK